MMPDPVTLVLAEAARINEAIAAGRTVHYQSSAVKPWRKITQATPCSRRIMLEFEDGSFRLERCWSAAVDAGCGYTLGWNLAKEMLT